MANTNKVKFGLSNLHFSRRNVAENGTVTYATPVACAGAVTLTITRSSEKAVFRADNIDFFQKYVNGSKEGVLEVSELYDFIKTGFLGYEVADDGMLVETDKDGDEFGLLFQVETDKEKKIYAIYNCKASQGDEEHKTTEQNDLGVQTSTLNIAISGEKVGDRMCYIKEVDSFTSLELPTFTESN